MIKTRTLNRRFITEILLLPRVKRNESGERAKHLLRMNWCQSSQRSVSTTSTICIFDSIEWKLQLKLRVPLVKHSRNTERALHSEKLAGRFMRSSILILVWIFAQLSLAVYRLLNGVYSVGKLRTLNRIDFLLCSSFNFQLSAVFRVYYGIVRNFDEIIFYLYVA